MVAKDVDEDEAAEALERPLNWFQGFTSVGGLTQIRETKGLSSRPIWVLLFSFRVLLRGSSSPSILNRLLTEVGLTGGVACTGLVFLGSIQPPGFCVLDPALLGLAV